MKNLTPVIYILIACNQWVYTLGNRAIYDNTIVYEYDFSGPRSNNYEDGRDPVYQTAKHQSDYDTSDENGRFVFPDWRIKASRRLRMKQCVASCQPNSAYQPICGSEGVIYHNLEQLECLMRCGVDINLRQLSPCGGRGTTTAKPAPTTESMTLNLNACTAQCPTTPEYNPVCGSDGITYNNPGKLSCAQVCGKDVQLHRRSPCPQLKAESTVEPISSRTAARAPRMRAACMTTCVTDPEYRPVCGTDYQTYFNMSRLKCAIRCGLDVSLLKSVACHIQENPNIINDNDDREEDYNIDSRYNKNVS